MAEGLFAAEVGKEVAEHREHVEHAEHGEHPAAAHAEHAKRDRWISIAEALMLSVVALIAAWSGYSAAKWSTHGPAFEAWLATHPLKNPHAPPDPSYMSQYRIPQETQARLLNAEADTYFAEGESSDGTADKYVRLTVLLAAVLFLVGIGSRFPLRAARYGLNAVAAGLLVVSVIQLLGLRGPPS